MSRGTYIFFIYSLGKGLVARALPGWDTALNHHPAFIAFPHRASGLPPYSLRWLRSGAGTDSIHRVALWLLWLGTIAATFAIVTGLRAAGKAPSGVGNPSPYPQGADAHQLLSRRGTFGSGGLAGTRSIYWAKVALLGGMLMLSGFMVLGTDRGAEMVGRYGFGVNGSIEKGARAAGGPTASVASLRYVGSKSCQPCHASIYARWKQTPMANVVRDPVHIRTPYSRISPIRPRSSTLQKTRLLTSTAASGSKITLPRWATSTTPCRGNGTSRIASGCPTLVKEDWVGSILSSETANVPTGPTCNGCHSVNYNIQRSPLRNGT